MAKKPKRPTERDDELSGRPEIAEKLRKVYADIQKGFTDQRERSDAILDYWDIYNCKLGERQFYNGRSEIFVPIVRDAVEARKTRFVNQMFPTSGRFVEVITGEQDHPHALVALLENYIRISKLRTQVMPALCVNGDVEGQYTIYVDWQKIERHVVTRETKPVESDGLEFPELGDIETIAEEKTSDANPMVEVISDADFLVRPATANSIDDALERGGSITIIRRWSKSKVEQLRDEDLLTEAAADDAIAGMGKKDPDSQRQVAEELADDAGIKDGQGEKYFQAYETWTKLEVDGTHRICRAYLGGADAVLGCKLNPNWSDKVNIASAPVKKIPGVFKGKSMIASGVMDMQLAANDAVNQGQDSLAFALAPLIAVDPEKVSRWQELIVDIGAVWPVDPDGMKPFTFPMLTQQAYEVVANAERRIFQSLSVNPSMMPHQTGGKKKLSQAEVANEQAVDVLTTADAVTNIEGEILTPMVQMFADLDHQHRSKELIVRGYGELGLKSEMQTIPPIQMNKRFWLRWFGVEAARNAAQIQQMIAAAATLMQVPPDKYPGYQLDMAPLMVHVAESAFTPRLARLIFKDITEQMVVEPDDENALLSQGMEVLVHMQDDDPKHLPSHTKLLQQVTAKQDGPAIMAAKAHIQRHQLQMQLKQQAQAMQVMQAQQGGQPGGGQPAPTRPRPGAQPSAPRRPAQRPAGSVHPDRMAAAGAVTMPRKF